MYRFHNNSNADRFDNYRDIAARFDSTGSCGHSIRKGDPIGWHPKLKKTQCKECWRKWCAENAEAESMERGELPMCW